MDISDNELAALAAAGDSEACRRLFERYQQPVYNFVYRMVDNAEDAADIVQNAFLKIYTVLGGKDIENFSAYLYRTAKNLAYDEMRRRQRFADVDQELLAPEDPNIYQDPQRALLLGEQLGQVRQAVTNLNENQRAALVLRELQGMDYDGMSEVLESNRNAVGALLSRARLKFREELRMVQVKTEQVAPECEEIIALLSPYIDGELEPARVETVEEHLKGCTFCTAALAEMQEASRSFRMLIPVVPPTDIAEAAMGSIEQMAAPGTPTGTEGDTGGATEAMPPEAGPGPEATRAYEGAATSGQSRLSRLVRNPFFWAGAASLALLAGAFLLFAGVTGRDGQDAAPAGLTGTQTQPSTSTQTATTAPTATTPAAPAGGGTTTTDGEPAAPFGIDSGYVEPASVKEGGKFSFSVDVSGSATSVTVKVAAAGSGETVGTYKLSRDYSGAGQESWSGGAVAGDSGQYYVYATAVSSGGQQDSIQIGSLSVTKSQVTPE